MFVQIYTVFRTYTRRTLALSSYIFFVFKTLDFISPITHLPHPSYLNLYQVRLNLEQCSTAGLGYLRYLPRRVKAPRRGQARRNRGGGGVGELTKYFILIKTGYYQNFNTRKYFKWQSMIWIHLQKYYRKNLSFCLTEITYLFMLSSMTQLYLSFYLLTKHYVRMKVVLLYSQTF